MERCAFRLVSRIRWGCLNCIKNIRFILRKPVDSVVGFPTTQIKRQKTQDNGDSVKIHKLHLRSQTQRNTLIFHSPFVQFRFSMREMVRMQKLALP